MFVFFHRYQQILLTVYGLRFNLLRFIRFHAQKDFRPVFCFLGIKRRFHFYKCFDLLRFFKVFLFGIV